MLSKATQWELVKGDGIAYNGPCVLKTIIFWPDEAADYADIYDGRDTTSGVKFCRVEADVDETKVVGLGDGVLFSRGIYVDGIDSAVETTVVFDIEQEKAIYEHVIEAES